MARKVDIRQNRRRVRPLTADAVLARLGEAAAHRVAGRHDEAIGLYEQIERSNPGVVDAPYFLALIDLARGRPAPALDRLRPLARTTPRSPDIWEALALVHRELGQWREASDASRRLLALRPDDLSERLELAHALEVLGRIEEAFEIYRALAAAPDSRLAALTSIANQRPGALTQAERDELTAAMRDESLDAGSRIVAGFAVASLLDGEARYDDAFAVLGAANRLKRRQLTGEAGTTPGPAVGPSVRALDPAVMERRHIEEIGFLRTVFTPEFLAAHAGGGHHLATPIFIVGMPRSGSTLIEQILSSHPKVTGLGENAALIEALADRFPYALFEAEQPAHFRRLADTYLAAMHARGWTSSPRFVDKMLRNYMHIGAIHLMFPRAVILHARRDAADTCLANFRQLFATGNELSYDLGDIGRDYVRYRAVMDHWGQVLPGRVIDVDHEALVADPEARIRWLVTEACGLAWDDACLRFHETRRAVRTASVAQVRQPIFTTSIQRWRRYENHLGPLFEALGPYAPASR
jgi:tetratricopeptide (TPR) repeat protein